MRLLGVVGIVLVGLLLACSSAGAEGEPLSARFFDPEDGWLDAGRFLDTAAGFLPAGRSPSRRSATARPSASPSSSGTPDWIEGEQPRPDIAGVGVLDVIFGSAWFRP